MFRVELTDEERAELNRRAHDKKTPPVLRDRLEMVRLAGSGMSVLKVARVLGTHEQTVRRWVLAFLTEGFDALRSKPLPGAKPLISEQMTQAFKAEVSSGERTWTAPQAAEWFFERFGVKVGRDATRRKLRKAGLSYKRTKTSLRHKQDPQQVKARSEELGHHEKRGT